MRDYTGGAATLYITLFFVLIPMSTIYVPIPTSVENIFFGVRHNIILVIFLTR